MKQFINIIDNINMFRDHAKQQGIFTSFGKLGVFMLKYLDFGFQFLNRAVRILFHIKLNDTTNAFKAYRKSAIDGVRPLISPHFNLTVEIPLKAIVRGFSWTIIPITWRNRRSGEPKLKIREMGSRYLNALTTFEEIIEQNVAENIYERHIRRVFEI